jgi:hypothetical protein
MPNSINHPVDPAVAAFYVVAIRRAPDYGGKRLFLDPVEFDEYNRDPDLFAARHFGFATADEYREWVHCHGYPHCSEPTKSGQLCRNPVGGFLKPCEWREQHRSRPCFLHTRRGTAP